MEALITTQTAAQEKHFDRWAGAYGRSRLLRSLRRKALAELDPRPDDRVLDVACGTGELVAALAPIVERVAGSDLSAGMLERARSRPLPDARNDVDWRQAPSDALPFADDEFTAVVCTTALHHFPDPQASISEMARVVAPGGRVVIGDSPRDAISARIADPLMRRFEAGHVGLRRKDEIEAMLTRAGLRVTRSRHVWVRLYAFVTAEKPR